MWPPPVRLEKDLALGDATRRRALAPISTASEAFLDVEIGTDCREDLPLSVAAWFSNDDERELARAMLQKAAARC